MFDTFFFPFNMVNKNHENYRDEMLLRQQQTIEQIDCLICCFMLLSLLKPLKSEFISG